MEGVRIIEMDQRLLGSPISLDLFTELARAIFFRNGASCFDRKVSAMNSEQGVVATREALRIITVMSSLPLLRSLATFYVKEHEHLGTDSVEPEMMFQ